MHWRRRRALLSVVMLCSSPIRCVDLRQLYGDDGGNCTRKWGQAPSFITLSWEETCVCWQQASDCGRQTSRSICNAHTNSHISWTGDSAPAVLQHDADVCSTYSTSTVWQRGRKCFYIYFAYGAWPYTKQSARRVWAQVLLSARAWGLVRTPR